MSATGDPGFQVLYRRELASLHFPYGAGGGFPPGGRLVLELDHAELKVTAFTLRKAGNFLL